jgi:hypothetical protein
LASNISSKWAKSLKQEKGLYSNLLLQVNVSVSIEIVSQLKLWEKFEGGKEVSLAEIVESTEADEIIISEYSLLPRP